MELKTYFAQDAAGNIISSAVVNVYLQGTTTLATGLTRADGTPLDNPFAADGAGRIQFRAPDGYYDLQVSAGSGIIQTLTIQCVDYSGAKDDADRAESAADRADVSAEQVSDAVALRSDLAASAGSNLVGFTGGDSTLFSYRLIADRLKDSLWFDDFKGSNDDERWASLYAYASTAIVTAISIQFSARTHYFSVSPTQLTKPFTLQGMGARSTILKFTGCNGVDADLSSYGSRYIQSRIANLSLVADSSNTQTGINFKGLQSFAPHDAALVLDNVSIYGFRDISTSGNTANEWAVAVNLNDVDEVHMHDVYISGSGLNANYSTRTSSKAIYANNTTGLRISASSIYLSGLGIEVTGQSEGAILRGLTIVAVDIGVTFHDLVNPSNNHVISDTHISAFTKGIEFRKHTDKINNPTAVYLSNIFLLEREGNASKTLYTGIECYATRSFLNAITIQSNNNTSPIRKGIIVSNQNNSISNIIGLNVGFGITIDAVDTLHVIYNGIRFIGDLQSDLAGSTQYAVGSGLANSGDPNSYNIRCDSFRTYDVQGREQYSSSGGRHMFGGGRQNTSVYHDFRCLPGGTSSYDGRIIFTGGSASVAGQADAVILAKSVAFGGDLASATANAFTCGTNGRPWAGGFTQTAFTITSDADCKSAPLLMTDDILDAAEEVQLVQYQYLDRIEEKGPDGARWHFGAIAQRYVEAFERHGLDAHRFGFICYDEWDDAAAVIDRNTGDVITPAIKAGSRYGIRYEEMLVMEAAVQRRNYARLIEKYEKLSARIDALEDK